MLTTCIDIVGRRAHTDRTLIRSESSDTSCEVYNVGGPLLGCVGSSTRRFMYYMAQDGFSFQQEKPKERVLWCSSYASRRIRPVPQTPVISITYTPLIAPVPDLRYQVT